VIKKSVDQASRLISTARLNTLLCLHLQPINLLVSKEPLVPIIREGYLILRSVSHLDAFSGYPMRRSLPSNAPGGTTGTRALRPSRSSRTRDSASQISSAHSG